MKSKHHLIPFGHDRWRYAAGREPGLPLRLHEGGDVPGQHSVGAADGVELVYRQIRAMWLLPKEPGAGRGVEGWGAK